MEWYYLRFMCMHFTTNLLARVYLYEWGQEEDQIAAWETSAGEKKKEVKMISKLRFIHSNLFSLQFYCWKKVT